MSSNILKGIISIFGINGAVAITGTGMIASTNAMLQGAPLRQETEEVDLVDSFGDTRTTEYHGEKHTIEVEFIPFSGDGTSDLPTLKTSLKRIVPGAIVTLSGFDVAMFNGDWNFSGKATFTPTARGYFRVTMTITRKAAAGGSGPVALT